MRNSATLYVQYSILYLQENQIFCDACSFQSFVGLAVYV